ncbi:primosomal protein N' family DNA-binding protein, partial [Rhodococcus aerolatus]
MSEDRTTPALPVARVALAVGLAHLDRDFDYAVPPQLDAAALPGVRVRVRFAGRLVDGFVVGRAAASEHAGRLATVEKVVSEEPVLTAEVAALARVVADRYAGTRADVLRLAVPPRHARTEAAEMPDEPWPAPAEPDRGAWRAYRHADAFLDALGHAGRPHAAWQALPGEDWPARLAELAAVTVAGGRRALLLVPDQRDLDAVTAACTARLGAGAVVDLSASLGPAARYRRWLRARRGRAAVVVGTRAAVFAPLDDLGLVAVWDDGDDSHAEPRAPYPHTREVAVLRAHAAGAAVVLAGHARTAEAAAAVEQGWAHDLVADRDRVRAAAPRVTALAETDTALARDPGARAARLPAVAFAAARQALEAGAAVLVQVPRRGYLPS